MTVLAAYRRSYDQIAADHVRSERAGHGNPFQSVEALERNERRTEELIREFVPWHCRVLDVGCGVGRLLSLIEVDYSAVGIDIATPYLDYCDDQGLRVEYGKAEGIPWRAAKFDCVVATDILEHVLDLNRVVKECLRVLKPGGVFVIRVPANEDLSQFMGDYTTYEYVHLRSFQIAEVFLLLTKIFPCEILTLDQDADVIHAAVRKP